MRKGFTLAEVLIALVTIGVLAALTIPSLVNNINDQQNRVAWKKTFADMSQVAMKIMADNGGTMKGIGTTDDTLRDSFLPYLNYIKTCNSGVNDGTCWATVNKLLEGSMSNFWPNKSKVVLNNGIALGFVHFNQNCNFLGAGNGTIPICGQVAVDVNGLNGPNTYGKDVFGFWVVENGIKPFGSQGDNTDCTITGWACSALYLYQ